MVNVDDYTNPDPFRYQTTPDDKFRLQMIRQVLAFFGPFSDALDLGAGEGWVTNHLPAVEKFAYEINEKARQRFPVGVKVFDDEARVCFSPFHLVTAMGVMYDFYDWKPLYKLLLENIALDLSYVLITGVTGWHLPIWEDGTFEKDSGLHKLKKISFGPYREYDSQTFYLFGPK